MRRLRRVFVTLMLLTAMVTLAAAPAAADHSLGGAEPGYDDPWADDSWDDPCLDPTLSDAEFEACLDEYDGAWSDGEDGQGDDPWSDEPWDEDGFGTGPWDAPEVDPTAAGAAVDAMDAAIDACFAAADDLGWCLLDAIDLLFDELFPFDEDLEAPWPGDGGFGDEPWTGDDWGDEPWFGGGLEPVDDPEAEAEIVSRFEELIPAEWRSRVVTVALETDGPQGVVASVEPLDSTLATWALYVDPADAEHELEATLIHEFAHIMTLNETQLDAQFVWSEQEHDEAAESCPTYFTGEGCARSGSYLAEFVDLFWDPIMDEFEAIEDIRDQWEREEALWDFYDRHADQFVSDYASVNPAEDISESFAAFVMAPELPDGDDVAEQKILFFSRFDELMALRESIRAAL